MKTSRQRLLETIQTHRAVTIAELCRALHTTEANVRHHLSILEERGLVQVVGQRPARGKGRPARLFGPSEHSLGHNLDLLSAALLEEIGRRYGPDASRGVLSGVAKRLVQEEDGQGSTSDSKRPVISLTKRLSQAIQRLNQFHYHARWEAHVQAPRIILGHCPYATILPAHPELCQMDAHLLEGLLAAQVDQLAKQARDQQGLPFCLFRVRVEPGR